MRHTAAKPATKLDLLILLPVFALLLLGGVWTAVSHQISEERTAARNETLARSQALAHTFAEYTVHILRQVDHALDLFKLNFEERDGKLTLADFIRRNDVMNRVLPTDIDTHLVLVDSRGMTVESTQPFTQASVAGEAYFQLHASRTTETLEVGQVLLEDDKKWLIHFSRRLNRKDGSFAGVAVFLVNPAYFIDSYDIQDLGEQGALVLLSPERTLSIRRIGEEVLVSRRLTFNSPPVADPTERINQKILSKEFDAVQRLYGAHALVEFELVALAGLTEDGALQKFTRRRDIYLWSAGLATLLIVAFTGILLRQSHQWHRAKLALQESEARLLTIANTLPAMVAYVDAEERYRFHNLAYERNFGLEVQHAHGRTVREVVGETRYAFLEPYIRRVLAGESLIYQEEMWKDGAFHCLETNYIPQFAPDGSHVAGFHVMRQDITVKKLEQIRLLQLAQVDTLTGLTNRAGFQLRLADAMKHSRESGGLMAIMYLDIDRFKPVNDTHGHSVGDALLKAFSGRLAHTFRSSDTVARLGGDEFTVVMENLSAAGDAITLAGKVVAAMREPFMLDGLEVSVSTSIGLAYYLGGEQSAEELIHQADVMLYEAKRAGRDCFKAAPAAQDNWEVWGTPEAKR